MNRRFGVTHFWFSFGLYLCLLEQITSRTIFIWKLCFLILFVFTYTLRFFKGKIIIRIMFILVDSTLPPTISYILIFLLAFIIRRVSKLVFSLTLFLFKWTISHWLIITFASILFIITTVLFLFRLRIRIEVVCRVVIASKLLFLRFSIRSNFLLCLNFIIVTWVIPSTF